MLGISQSYISRLEKKIISRLQKEMKNLYNVKLILLKKYKKIGNVNNFNR